MASSITPTDPATLREIIKGGSHVLVIAFCMFILWTWNSSTQLEEVRRHEALMQEMQQRNAAMLRLLERCGPRNQQQSQIRKVPTIQITPTRGPLITNKGITDRFGPFKEQLPP